MRKYFCDEPNKNKRKVRPPLRTLKELAIELGVDQKTLQGKLARHHLAPKPVINGRNFSNPATWYNRDDVLNWWASMSYNAKT